jgi:F-type H+-transporting ATPase subunit b
VEALTDIVGLLPLAAEEEGGSFLVTPGLGLMIWTLIAFGATLLILRKLAFPRIGEALDKRRRAIEESIEQSERVKKEADELLAEYRARLSEAREQSEDIVTRARKAADRLQDESKAEGKRQREEMMESTRREIQAETRRGLDEIRKEVAALTVMATEKGTPKTLTGEDHQRLIQEALEEADFKALAGADRTDGGSNGDAR